MIPAYTIVIPTRNLTNLKRCREAIESCNGPRSQPAVVDDDETGAVKGFCLDWMVGRIPGVKPFVFSRNVNLAIREFPSRDILILNDDALLETRRGFDQLAAAATMEKEYGVVAAAVRGAVGCREQMAMYGEGHHAYMAAIKEFGTVPEKKVVRIRPVTHHTVTFICVYLRRDVIDRVGLLDERFEFYSHQDDDYCQRVRDAGYKLGVFDGCVVEHGISLKSTFRHDDEGKPKHQDLTPGLEMFVKIHGHKPGEKG